jgi:tetratricopeptide (TPR) repeat protein
VKNCNAALAMDPGSFRAHTVRCLANIYLSNFVLAHEDHEMAVKLCGENLVLLENLEELRTALDIVSTAAVFGSSREKVTVPEWLGDFGLLGFEMQDDADGEMGGVKPRKDAQHGMPKLVPIGEWMGSDVCEQLLDYTSYKLPEKALKEKQKGNAEFAAGNFQRALELYTRAIKLHPEDGIFYSNRALAYLRLGRFEEAVSDCSASIARGATIKAYARRAAAYDGMGLHKEAARDHRQALAFEPRNPGCLSAFKECLELLLVLPDFVGEDRELAERNLHDMNTLGRISDETMFIPPPQPAPPVNIKSTHVVIQQKHNVDQIVGGEKKKRTAGAG